MKRSYVSVSKHPCEKEICMYFTKMLIHVHKHKYKELQHYCEFPCSHLKELGKFLCTDMDYLIQEIFIDARYQFHAEKLFRIY